MKNSINTILERRSVNVPINAVLFLANFVIVSYVWRQSAPDLAGLGRLTICWAAASGLTWMMTSYAKGIVRLALAILLLGVLTYIMTLHGM
jgi:hypothetical protein